MQYAFKHLCFSQFCAILPTHSKGGGIKCIRIAVNTSSVVGGVTLSWVNGTGCAMLPSQIACRDAEEQEPVDNGVQTQATSNASNDAKEHRRLEENWVWVKRRDFMVCVRDCNSNTATSYYTIHTGHVEPHNKGTDGTVCKAVIVHYNMKQCVWFKPTSS